MASRPTLPARAVFILSLHNTPIPFSCSGSLRIKAQACHFPFRGLGEGIQLSKAVFFGCFSAIAAQGTWFQTPCPTCRLSRPQRQRLRPDPRERGQLISARLRSLSNRIRHTIQYRHAVVGLATPRDAWWVGIWAISPTQPDESDRC